MAKRFVKCIRNTGYPVSLTIGRVYEVVEPSNREATDFEANDLLRVIDNSGEDYVHPKSYFEETEETVQKIYVSPRGRTKIAKT
jgi:hypothetical protein